MTQHDVGPLKDQHVWAERTPLKDQHVWAERTPSDGASNQGMTILLLTSDYREGVIEVLTCR